MNIAKRERSQKRQSFLDTLYMIMVIVVIAISLTIISVLIGVWAAYLKRASRWIVQTWAITATILVPIGIAAGTAVGIRLSRARIEWFKQDWMQALSSTFDRLADAAVDLTDVRIYGARRLYGREDKDALEIDHKLPEIPWSVDTAPAEPERQSQTDVIDVRYEEA